MSSQVERLRITSTGQLIVGNNPTVDSNTVLHVERNAECNINLEGNVDGVGGYLMLKNNSTQANSGMKITGNDAGGQAVNEIYFISVNNDNNEGELRFGTRPSGGSMQERLRIDSDGDVGINETNPSSKLHVRDDSATETAILKLRNYKSGVNTKPTLRFEAVTSAGQGANADIQGLAGTDAGGANNVNESGLKFIVRHGGAGTSREAYTIKKDGNIHFPNGQGINFGASAGGNASSTLFDDYEEGTWTPLLHGYWSSGWRQITIGSGTVEGATYTRIGRLVCFKCYFNGITMSGNGPNTYARIYGLPFQAANNGYGAATMVTHSTAFENTDTGSFYISPNASDMIATRYGEDDTGYARWSQSSFYMMLSGVYEAA